MLLTFVRDHTLPAAYSLLPRAMDSDAADVMLLAIGLQESRFKHRRQIRGPARSYWQFERGGGVVGVLDHPSTKTRAESVCHALDYEADSNVVYEAMGHNDVLAACFARLLLWTHPEPIPRDHRAAWNYYLSLWRPGKPHPDSWAWCFREAEHAVRAKGD